MAQDGYGTKITNTLPHGPFDGAVLAVKHDEITRMSKTDIRNLLTPKGLTYDIKAVLPTAASYAGL